MRSTLVESETESGIAQKRSICYLTQLTEVDTLYPMKAIHFPALTYWCASALLLFPCACFAEISLLFTATSGHVATTAGSDDRIGIQEPPANGVIRNRIGVSVADSPLKADGGLATCDISVTTPGGSTITALLQATASALPEFGEATSQSSVTLGFTQSTKVFVSVDILQGGTELRIDGVRADFQRGAENEFRFTAGQHKFEVAAESKLSARVSNPNIAITLNVEEFTDTPAGGVNPDPADPGVSPNAALLQQANSLQSFVAGLTFPKSAAAKKGFKGQLTNLASLLSTLRAIALANKLTIVVKGKVSLSTLIAKVRAAATVLKQATTKKDFAAAKAKLLSAIQALVAALS